MEFKIPALPPSMNQLYKVNYYKRSVYMDKSGKDFMALVHRSTPPFTFKEQQPLKVTIEYHGNWFNKGNKKIKRKDGQNLNKCLYDALFAKGGVDDSQAFEGHWKKVQDKEEYTLVRIEEVNFES